MEAIYEGYLLHYGQPRLFAPRDDGERLLCGDHLYAQGLVWIAAIGDLAAIDALRDADRHRRGRARARRRTTTTSGRRPRSRSRA